MISGQEEIAVQKNSIEKLDLVLKELMAEKNPTGPCQYFKPGRNHAQGAGQHGTESAECFERGGFSF